MYSWYEGAACLPSADKSFHPVRHSPATVRGPGGTNTAVSITPVENGLHCCVARNRHGSQSYSLTVMSSRGMAIWEICDRYRTPEKGGDAFYCRKKIRHQSKLTERLKARRPNFMLKSKVEIHYSKLYQNSLSGLSFTPWIFPKCMYLHLYFRFRFLYFSYFLCYGLYYLWRS